MQRFCSESQIPVSKKKEMEIFNFRCVSKRIRLAKANKIYQTPQLFLKEFFIKNTHIFFRKTLPDKIGESKDERNYGAVGLSTGNINALEPKVKSTLSYSASFDVNFVDSRVIKETDRAKMRSSYSDIDVKKASEINFDGFFSPHNGVLGSKNRILKNFTARHFFAPWKKNQVQEEDRFKHAKVIRSDSSRQLLSTSSMDETVL